MKQVFYRLLLPLLLALPLVSCWFTPAREAVVTSGFNSLTLDEAADWSSYSFVVFGHIRADQGPPDPNPRLRTSTQTLWKDNPSFVVSLGDMYYQMGNGAMEGIQEWIREEIPVPFFNAVGNHDTLRGGTYRKDGSKIPSRHDVEAYTANFGELYQVFYLGSEAYIFLDTGRGYGISRPQWEFFKATIDEIAADSRVKNVILFTHKIIWSYYNEAMAPVFRYRHPVRPPQDSNLFLDKIKPRLLPLTHEKSVYLFSGDLGGGGNFLQTFYLRDDSFTYIASGMGGTSRDGFVTVSVDAGKVKLKHTNLTTARESSLEDFGVRYWEEFYAAHPREAALTDRIGPQPVLNSASDGGKK